MNLATRRVGRGRQVGGEGQEGQRHKWDEWEEDEERGIRWTKGMRGRRGMSVGSETRKRKGGLKKKCNKEKGERNIGIKRNERGQ